MAETAATGSRALSVDSLTKATSCPLALQSLSASSLGPLVPDSSDCPIANAASRVTCLSDSTAIDTGTLKWHVAPCESRSPLIGRPP